MAIFESLLNTVTLLIATQTLHKSVVQKIASGQISTDDSNPHCDTDNSNPKLETVQAHDKNPNPNPA